jgi:ankyrin repeat protein
MVEVLLAGGADNNAKDNDGEERLAMAEFLIEHGADVNMRANKGQASLHLTARFGQEAMARLLLKHGANVNVQDDYDATPLSDCVLVNRYESMMALFRQHGASEKTLCEAAITGNVERLKELLTEGQDVNAFDRLGRAPLHHAAVRGHEEVVRLLLEAGADPEASDTGGATPADLASYSVAVRRLLDAYRASRSAPVSDNPSVR